MPCSTDKNEQVFHVAGVDPRRFPCGWLEQSLLGSPLAALEVIRKMSGDLKPRDYRPAQ